jgi:hypothetical protein
MRIRSNDRWLSHAKLMVFIYIIMVILGTINVTIADDDSQNDENGNVDFDMSTDSISGSNNQMGGMAGIDSFGTTVSLQWPPVINITSVSHDRAAELKSVLVGGMPYLVLCGDSITSMTTIEPKVKAAAQFLRISNEVPEIAIAELDCKLSNILYSSAICLSYELFRSQFWVLTTHSFFHQLYR